MKKYIIFFALLSVVLISLAFVNINDGKSIQALVSRDVAITQTKGTPLTIAPIAVISGDSVYFSSFDIRGTWTTSTPAVQIWPWRGFQYLKDTTDENPLSRLDYAGIFKASDTTWGVTNTGTGGKYSISKTYTQTYSNGKYSQAAYTGFLAPNKKYFIDVYTVTSGAQVLAKTLGFDVAGGDTAFGTANFYASYVASGLGVYPAAATPRPDSLTSATVYARLRFQVGKATKGFSVPNGTDSLRFVVRADQTVLTTNSVPVSVVTSSQLGANPSISIATPTPLAGYFAAGDSIDLNFDIKDDGGTSINWWTNPLSTGISRVELLVSGPKRDYERVYALRNVVNTYTMQYDSIYKKPYSGNPIRFVLPKTLVNGNGTYTIFMNVSRVFGTSTSIAVLKDFQVGTSVVDSLPVSSNQGGKSCASCHGVGGVGGVSGLTGHHSAKGAEQCLPCHTDNMPTSSGGVSPYAFSELVHVFHQEDPLVNIPIGNCVSCHDNGSENQFTSDAAKICGSCHGVVPYMPTDHSTVPLYATSGMSCANLNCHAGGTLGVFKNISETHAVLATKYADKDIVAKETRVKPVVDGTIDQVWSAADSITTKTGVKLKFLFDSTYLYTLAVWKDGGHKMYTGSAVVQPTKSLARNKWTFDGTNWTKSGNEDRLAFTWKMTDPLNASCAKTCHDVGVGHLTASAKMDSWHWKAQRTDRLGFADDGYWDNAGRKTDAILTGTFGWDNLNAAGTLPIYMAKTPSASTDFLLGSNTVPFVNSGFTAGAIIPGWVSNDSTNPAITGSRADVITGSSYNETTGVWTVELRRMLKTNNTADDVQFDPALTYPFTLAQFDNASFEHASQGVDITNYNLKFAFITSVKTTPGKPEKFALEQNYPNPFNPSTTIKFSLKERVNVKISLYSISGELVSNLYSGVTEAGYHSVKFDARNLSSGIYLYKIEAGSFVETKKMVFMK